MISPSRPFVPRRFVHRHIRLLLASFAGVAAGALSTGLSLSDRLLIGVDLFFAIYLGSCFVWLRGLRATDLRARFEDGDEGAGFSAALAVGIVIASLYAIIATLTQGPAPGPIAHLRPVLALAAVPLGWTTLHMVFALHYAGAFYRAEDRRARGEGVEQDSPDAPDAAQAPKDSGGLDFAGDWPEPGPWEFLYYSFTIGMTAQTSDTAVTSTEMRRLTLIHGALSYFYNAVIVALAVNAGMSLGQ